MRLAEELGGGLEKDHTVGTDFTTTAWLDSRLFVELISPVTDEKNQSLKIELESVFHESQRRHPRGSFLSYCRLLPPREIAKSF